MIIGKDRVRMELGKYYRWFVKDFAKIARLLYEMTRKEIK